MADSIVHPDQGILDNMPEPLPPPPPQPFELSGRVEIEVEVTVDLAGLIREFQGEYKAVDMSGGHAAWERPLVFLHEYLSDGDGPYFGPHVSEGFDDFEFRERKWNEEEFEKLCLVCPEARVSA